MSARGGWMVPGAVSGMPQEIPRSDHEALIEIQELSRRGPLGGDAAAAAAVFEDGAVLMPPGAPSVEGRTAIQAFWEAGPSVERVEIDVLDIGGDGDVAYVRGTCLMVFAGLPGESAEQTGKFLQVLRRQADGRWLIRADMFSPDGR